MLKIVDATNFKLASLLGEAGWSRRFMKYWGHNGTVFNKRVYVYPKSYVTGNANTTKLLKLLGAYNDIMNMDPKGVDSMWLYLNPEKLTATSANYFTSYFLAQLIEDNMELDKWYEFTLNYVLSDSALFDLNGIDLYTYTKNHWSTIHTQLYSTSSTQDMVKLGELSKFFFYEQDTQDFVMEYVSATKTVGTVFSTESTVYNRQITQATVAVTFKVKRVSEIQETASIVTHIMNTSSEIEKARIVNDSQHEYEESTKIWSWVEPVYNNEIWSNSQLRVEYWNNLKFKDRCNLVGFTLDQDFQKKKAKWWQELLVIIIVIVIVVFLKVPPQIAAQGAAAVLAFYATVIALTMMIVSTVAANNGDYALAEFAGNIGQIAGKIAIVAGFIAMVQGINTAIQKAAEEAATRSATQIALQGLNTDLITSVTQELGTEVLQGTMVDASVGATSTSGVLMENIINSATTNTMDMVNKVLSIISKINEMIAKNKLKGIESSNDELTKKVNELEQKRQLDNDSAYSQSLDPYKTMTIQASPFLLDQSQFYYEQFYQPTKYNICTYGMFQPIGMFSPGYGK